MPDMESMDRAVEVARAALWIVLPEGVGPEVRVAAEAVNDAISHLEAAVSAKARAEERERVYEERRKLKTSSTNVSPWYRARSSEEAGNGS